MVNRFFLVDVFRNCCPNVRGVKWHNTRGVSRRLDYVFVSSSVVCVSACVTPLWFSGHCGVSVVVSVEGPVFGRGYWKLNVSILQESEFRALFYEYFDMWVEMKELCNSVVEWWEGTKRKIRPLAQFYCKRRRARERRLVVRLQAALEAAYCAANRRGPLDIEQVGRLKAHLAEYYTKKAKAFLFQSRCEALGQDECCSLLFFNSVRSAQKRRLIMVLKDRARREVRKAMGMVSVASTHFQDFFKEREVDVEGARFFLDGVSSRVPVDKGQQ